MSIRNDLLDEQLNDRVDRLLMVTQALWELVRDETGLSDDDLFRRIEAVDLADGVADRRRQTKPLDCRCGAKFNVVTHACDFCGTTATTRSIFDLV